MTTCASRWCSCCYQRCAVLVILVAVLFGLALPLDPVQILWINMVTAIALSLALAYEPAEPDLMTLPA